MLGADYNNNNTYENTWGYDAARNRITENYGTAKTYTFDNLNRMATSLSGSKTYTHDKVGNRLTMDQGTQRQTMTWDFTNRMTSVTDGVVPGSGNNVLVWGADSSYEYRADGLRSSKVVHANLQQDVEEGGPSSFFDFNYLFNDATTRYFYDGQMCASEDYVCYSDPQKSDVNEDVTRYMLGARGIDMIEALRVHGASGDNSVGVVHQSFPIYDGHGNMLATLVKVKDSSGNVTGATLTNEKRYDAWGAAFVNSGPGGALVNPNTSYCANLGHKEDSESGLTYMRARYYEPGTGRFISEDCMADGKNWYVYCSNNPLNIVDKSGCDGIALQAALFAVGFAAGVGLGNWLAAYILNSFYMPMQIFVGSKSAADRAMDWYNSNAFAVIRGVADTVIGGVLEAIGVAQGASWVAAIPPVGAFFAGLGIGFTIGFLTSMYAGICLLQINEAIEGY